MPVKIINRNFSKTAGRTPIFEVRIVIYDQRHVQYQVRKTFNASTFEETFLAFSPSRALLAAMPMARRAGTTRPKAMARLQKIFIRFQAACQIDVTQ